MPTLPAAWPPSCSGRRGCPPGQGSGYDCTPASWGDKLQRSGHVFRIQIHRIHMFFGLPDPDSLVRGVDPDPDPSIIKQNGKKTLDSYCFVTSFGLFIFGNDVNVHTLVRGMDPRIQTGSTPKCHGSGTLALGIRIRSDRHNLNEEITPPPPPSSSSPLG